MLFFISNLLLFLLVLFPQQKSPMTKFSNLDLKNRTYYLLYDFLLWFAMYGLLGYWINGVWLCLCVIARVYDCVGFFGFMWFWWIFGFGQCRCRDWKLLLVDDFCLLDWGSFDWWKCVKFVLWVYDSVCVYCDGGAVVVIVFS